MNREGHPGTSVYLRFALTDAESLCGCAAAS
jgi:hypothetical protein